MIEEHVQITKYKGEIKANKYILRCMVVTFLVYTVAWLLNVMNIFIVDNDIMNRGLVGMCAFILAVYVLTKIYGYDKPWMKFVIMFLAVAMYSFVVMMMTYHVVLITVFPLICSIQYTDKKMEIYTYILTVIGIFFSVMVGYKYGLCDGNILLLTYTTTSEHMEILRSGVFDLNEDILTLLLFFVFPRCMVTTAFIPILNRLRSDIEERTVHEAAARRRAEIDDMTGFFNKNKYLDMISSVYPKIDNVAVVFWDVNNLKKVNDEYGHEVGDLLIAEIADTLEQFVDDDNKVYRVGGDEFVMICANPDDGDVEGIISTWKRTMSGRVINDTIEVSAAVGYADGNGCDIQNIIKQADDDMYKNKNKMKQKNK